MHVPVNDEAPRAPSHANDPRDAADSAVDAAEHANTDDSGTTNDPVSAKTKTNKPAVIRTSPRQEADLASLRPYPGAHIVQSAPHFAALKKSIQQEGVLVSLRVAGDDCASPRGTVLSGGLRLKVGRELESAKLPVTYLDGLTADEEEREVLLGNIQASSRPMLASEVWGAERRLAELEGKRQGQRIDLTGGPTGRTSEIISRITGATKNSVQTRHKVFSSPFVDADVRKKLDAKAKGYSMARVATTIRRMESDWHELTPILRREVDDRSEHDKAVLASATATLHQLLEGGFDEPDDKPDLRIKSGDIDVALSEEFGALVGESTLKETVRVSVKIQGRSATLTFEGIRAEKEDDATSVDINTGSEGEASSDGAAARAKPARSRTGRTKKHTGPR